jgi:cytochrome c biogenesis protein CcdA
MFGLVVLVATANIAGDYQAASVARARHTTRFHLAAVAGFDLGFVVAIFYLFTGLSLLRKARFWAGRAGPVQRLVTHARGRAYGFLAAIPCQLGIMMALLFAN